MEKIKANRVGSNKAKFARGACNVLAILLLAAAVFVAVTAYDFDDVIVPIASFVTVAFSLFFLAAHFRVIGCIAYDLETIAAIQEAEHKETTEIDHDWDHAASDSH